MARELTHYELKVLIRNEVELMYEHFKADTSPMVIKSYAERVINYCNEWHALPDIED